jgi:integrase/recombinase XerC
VRKANALGFIHWTLDVSNEKADACKNSGELGVRHIRKMFTISGNQKNSAKAARDICVLRLLYDLALKRSAIVRLDFKDVDLIKGQIAVDVSSIQGKKLKKLPGKTREALENWIKLRGRRDGPLFTNFDRAGKGKRLTGTSVYRIVRQIGNEIGVQTRPNGFRRAAITCAVKKARSAGLELEEIIVFSDHTSKKSLSDYQEGEKRIQERVSRLIAI